METTKHTPIPWCYVKGYEPHNQGQVYYEDNGRAVALTYNDEDGANARLIAAAADMLAALQELLADSYLGNPINGDRMRAAREAVAKAGGEPRLNHNRKTKP